MTTSDHRFPNSSAFECAASIEASARTHVDLQLRHAHGLCRSSLAFDFFSGLSFSMLLPCHTHSLTHTYVRSPDTKPNKHATIP